MRANLPGNNISRTQPQQAFSLIEIMLTVAMLTVIILGLVAMFDQTRRAFTSSMTQVDLLEGGRATAAFIANDLEQMTPTYASNSAKNLPLNFENFYMDVPPTYVPTLQPLSDPTEFRTNTLEEFFFVSRYNQFWNVIGYKIDLLGEGNRIGTLYRFSSNNIPVTTTNLTSFLTDFTGMDPSTNSACSKIIDGVIDFQVRMFDPNGNLLQNTNNANPASTNNIFMTQSPPGTPVYRFRSNAVPAFVEVELGILENRTLQRYYSMTNNMPVALGYLTNHAGQVHIFRQRVPIRAVDATAYNTNLTTALP